MWRHLLTLPEPGKVKKMVLLVMRSHTVIVYKILISFKYFDITNLKILKLSGRERKSLVCINVSFFGLNTK